MNQRKTEELCVGKGESVVQYLLFVSGLPCSPSRPDCRDKQKSGEQDRKEGGRGHELVKGKKKREQREQTRRLKV